MCPLGTVHSTRVRAQLILKTGIVDTGTYRVEYYALTHAHTQTSVAWAKRNVYCVWRSAMYASAQTERRRTKQQRDHKTVYQWKSIVLTLKTRAERQLSGAKATRKRARAERDGRERRHISADVCLWRANVSRQCGEEQNESRSRIIFFTTI